MHTWQLFRIDSQGHVNSWVATIHGEDAMDALEDYACKPNALVYEDETYLLLRAGTGKYGSIDRAQIQRDGGACLLTLKPAVAQPPLVAERVML